MSHRRRTSRRAPSPLATATRTGQGATQDYGHAMTWYRKAAGRGRRRGAERGRRSLRQRTGRRPRRGRGDDLVSQSGRSGAIRRPRTTSATSYANGQGVAFDVAQAVAWYRKAADQGLRRRRRVSPTSTPPARRGAGLRTGDDLVPQSRRSGHPAGENGVGYLYAYGRGVPRDYAQAMSWYRKAADKNYAVALNNIGRLFADGLGVPADFAQAMTWYPQGGRSELFGGAGQHRARSMSAARASRRITAQPAEWLRKAADQGFAPAQNDLGKLYADGPRRRAGLRPGDDLVPARRRPRQLGGPDQSRQALRRRPRRDARRHPGDELVPPAPLTKVTRSRKAPSAISTPMVKA